jgi:hypothetical protein
MYDGEESLHAACRQSGRKGGAPMEVAKIGGPTGIEGSLGCLLSSHPHVETAGSMFRLSWGSVERKIFFTNGTVTRCQRRRR